MATVFHPAMTDKASIPMRSKAIFRKKPRTRWKNLKRVFNSRARRARITAGMDAGMRGEIWLLMFDCIELGRHTQARRVIRQREARLKVRNAAARVPDERSRRLQLCGAPMDERR